MNDALISLPTPVETLMVTESPCRELCNFLIYQNNPELLNERARRQPVKVFENLPTSVKQVGELLGAEKSEKNRKLYFNCTETENHRGILIHNFNAQFWVHYFRCGIGLVNISCFSQLASAQDSVLPLMTRTVADSYEYQWFTHDLSEKFFQKDKSEVYIKKLAEYFVEKVNQNLASPYLIFSEEKKTQEPYKFVQGSLVNLKETLKQAIVVCGEVKRRKDPQGKSWVSPYLTITCGSLRQSPSIEHSTESFLNQIGALAIKENVPFTVLNDCSFRRIENGYSDFIKKNKHHIHLNLQDEIQSATPRAKIAARFQLINWLKKQGRKGDWIVKLWKLESTEKSGNFTKN